MNHSKDVAQALGAAVVIALCIRGFDHDLRTALTSASVSPTLVATIAAAIALCVAGMYLPFFTHEKPATQHILFAILVGQLGVLAMCVLHPLVAVALMSTNLLVVLCYTDTQKNIY